MMKLRLGKEIGDHKHGQTSKQRFLGKTLAQEGLQIISFRK